MVYEIGSEFDFNYERVMSNQPKDLDEVFKTSEYKLLSSGRCGVKQVLLNLLKENDGKDEFLLPSYLCPSIVQSYNELNLKIVYYNINPDLTIDLDDLKSKVNQKTKAVYFIHYFGVLQPADVISDLSSLKERKICLLEDITHNFFSKRADIGDFLIASLRKWGPLPHGGLVIKNTNAWEYDDFYESANLALEIGQLRAFGQQLKYLYVNGLKSEEVKNTYLPILQKMDQALYSHIEIVPMDELSVNILKRMDFENLSKKRRENYKVLYENLKEIQDLTFLIGDIKDVVTPLGFHLALDNRDDLRKYLVQNGIYASVHWGLPPEVQTAFKEPTRLSKRILTIPCDQRYGQKEMEYIVEKVRTYFFEKQNRHLMNLNEVGEGV